MDLRKTFIKTIVNPLIWRYVKQSKRFIYFNEMKKKQWNSIEKNKKEQAQKLYRLIRYCDKNISYYQKIIQKNNITYSKDTIFEDIKKFPIITKKEIRGNFNLLRNPKIKGYKNTSGGSTGEQVEFLQDKNMYDHDAGTKGLFKEWAGRNEGELIIKLWGSERDFLKGGSGFQGFLVRTFTNIILLNTYRMTNNNMRKYIKIINEKKPKIIVAYVQDAFEFSKFISENKIKVYSPTSIITSAGTLFPKFKEVIEKAFRCHVFNRYGSREAGDMACDCEKHEGLHMNIFNYYIEILDNTLQDVTTEGSKGEIYVTHLHNYVMPLIRYKIGDIGQVTNKKCSCGRGMPLLQKIEGRVGCTLRTKKAAVSSTALTTTFYLKSIKKYQVIQNKNKFLIKVEINSPQDWKKDKKILHSKLKKIFEDGVFEFKIVDEIMPTKSGKFLYLINENEFK